MDGSPASPVQVPRTVPGLIRVSSAQEDLWLAQKLVPGLPNNISAYLDVSGEIDRWVMDTALRRVLGEAQSVLVNFVEDVDGPRQVARDPNQWNPFFVDVSGDVDPESVARASMADLVGQPFDLERDALYRAGLIKLGDFRYFLFAVSHHLVMDGFGVAILARRIAEVYTSLATGASIPESGFGGPELINAEDARYRRSGRFTRDREFWRDYTAGLPEPLRLLGDRSSPDLVTLHCSVSVSGDEFTRWAEASESMGVPVPAFLAAAAAGFLHRISGMPEFVVRLAVANRVGRARSTPGMMANAVPLGVKCPPGSRFVDVARGVGAEILSILRHCRYQGSDIRRDMGLSGSVENRFGPVLNIIPFFGSLDFAGSSAVMRGVSFGPVDDLSISVYYDRRGSDGMRIEIDGNGAIYSGEDLRLYSDLLVAFTRAVTANPSGAVRAIDILEPTERALMLRTWNETAVAIPEVTVPGLFERQVAATPDAVALTCGDEQWTYREVNARANRWARLLIGRGVGPESVVGVALPRSAELVIALLAILKAGGAYLPIDPNYPSERIGFVLDDADPLVVLTDTATAAVLPHTDIPRPRLDLHASTSTAVDSGGRSTPVMRIGSARCVRTILRM
ncbi:condensation domain-containing protein (plasmid) [Rhodococcus opacus]|uniref:condensation domain-containing protein n=1 Tax=Rhodococcus opacus TaxID=37919 RepID=UPI0021578117|nr:condensation domain-containing protein [Rhodococcus opacus]UUK33965.1 condensation domain-containing protein [Rhodococcus opacus]